jgi:hypothetical protein
MGGAECSHVLVEAYWLGDYRPACQPTSPLLRIVIRAARLRPQDGANLAP